MNRKYSMVFVLTIIFNMFVVCDMALSDNYMASKPYTIVSISDSSMKAVTKNLSEYSIYELESLPVKIRKKYKIVVNFDISKEDLKRSMKHLVAVETKKNPDIDEIVIFAYERKEDAESGAFLFGKMEWCPNGNWEVVTPEIASNNDRSSYKFVFDINDKVGKISNVNRPTKEEFAIYDACVKEYRADQNVDEKILELRMAKKFGISVDKLDKIRLKILAYGMR